MKKINWKELIPHIIAIAVFLIVALIYCKPALEGKVLQQSDITQWTAMAKDQYNYKDAHGEIPLWSNGMFSGMPGYLIVGKNNSYVGYYFSEALSLFLAKPFKFFFLACVCFYFLALALRVNPWVSMMGALCYAYATYNPVIVSVGHDTKMLSIAMLPGFIGALVWVYEKKYWLGATLLAFFTAALITQNHYQIVYYGVIIAFFMTIGYAINWIKNKDFKHLLTSAAIVVVAGGIGVLSNAVVLFTNYDYTKATIRGGSELADSNSNTTKEGLSKKYAFDYSMYKTEPMVMMFPRIFGGSSSHPEITAEKSKTMEAIQQLPQGLQQQVAPSFLGQNEAGEVFPRTYWGGIGGTSGPPYLGAIICFLALIGFVVLNGKHKWWILAATALTFMMSWGGYFEGFNAFFLDHLPMYNKFRAPSMIIVVPTLLLSMLAVLSLNKVLFESNDPTLLWKKYKQGLIVVASIFVVALLMYMSFDFSSEGDKAMAKQIAAIPDATQKAQIQEALKPVISAIKEDRKSLALGDIGRSLLFVLAAAALLWAAIKNKIKPVVAVASIGVLAFIDVLVIDATYLNSSNYKDKEEYTNSFAPRPVDTEILKDKSYYRVLDLSSGDIGSVFNQGAMPTSYFHKSIGGYHPAKLSIYQDLIEKQLYNFPNCMPVINMLNTKYVIQNNQGKLQITPNPTALGAAWFVKNIEVLKTPQAVMTALTKLNTKDSAVTETSFAEIVKGSFITDSANIILLIKNENDIATYKSKTNSPQFAVFSEVYYDRGWNAYLDGKLVPHAKVNYVLRGMPVPAGEHEIVFKFEPKSHALGWTITNICSLLMLALLVLGVFMEFKKKKKVVVE